MLMENTAQLNDAEQLIYIFDLKGSTVDRKTKGTTKPSTTLKDQDFQLCNEHYMKKGSSFISLRPTDRLKLIAAMRKDVKFLKSQNLMDYSLLLVIEKKQRKYGLNNNIIDEEVK